MIEIRRTFNRDRGFKLVETLNGYTFTPETNAHTFFIECVDKVNGLETVVPFEAGSTVSARFLKTDHVTELVEGSLNTDGAAVVTLPSECYSVPGRFLLTILVTTGSTTICVYAATGTVIAADSSTVNVSENASREIDEKIAELNAAAAQVSSAISAGSAKITEINQAAAAARASIPQDYTALSDSVGDLKSAVDLKDGKIPLAWTDGRYLKSSDGSSGTSSKHAITGFVPVVSGRTYYVNASSVGSGEATLCFYTTNAVSGYQSYIAHDGQFEYTPNTDGYIRIGTRKETIPTADCYLAYIADLGVYAKTETVVELSDLMYKKLSLTYTDGMYLKKSNGSGTTSGASNYYATNNYYPVKAGQALFCNLFIEDTDSAAAVCVYNSSKTFVEAYSWENRTEPITIAQDGYVRFCSRKTLPMAEAYVINSVGEVDEIRKVSGVSAQSANIANVLKSATTAKKYYAALDDAPAVSASDFYPAMPKQEQKYTGEVTPLKRYLAIGFDDFRASDFAAIMPLFEKYGGKATFNRIIRSVSVSDSDRKQVNNVLFGNHEMGDHTILHYAFPYCDALFNGQDPANPDGNQTPYPTNAMFRNDTGNGRNIFNQLLTNTVSLEGYSVESTWANLTDAQCQGIREHYSAMKNTTLRTILDEMSNKYLGTTGTSDGSWDSSTGKYTGGIFTGCATSANHEIWERILQCIQFYYKDVFGYNNDLLCWSYPGGDNFGLGLLYGDLKYYDAEHTKLYDMNARFTSSLYTDELGNAKSRSFTDVLREFGYRYTHDYNYPGRRDNVTLKAMSKQFIINADLSRIDGIPYPTNRTVAYNNLSNAYPASFFTIGKTKAAQMYDGGGEFYNFIEALRHDTANGLVHGEVIDSFDTYSEKMFFEQALEFCQAAGIEVVTKAEAYDICFNHPVRNGNLIYNPLLRNTAKEILTDAVNAPNNPDGYTGNCSVEKVNGVNVLTTSGDTTYIHYGIPYGKIKYSAEIKGIGTLTVYTITNETKATLANASTLTTVQINNADFADAGFETIIKNADTIAWEQVCEGLGNKIMGLKFVYSSGLQIKNIRLEMI